MNTTVTNLLRLKRTYIASKSLMQFIFLLGLSFVVIPSVVLITLAVVSIYGYIRSSSDWILLISNTFGG